MSLFRPTVRLRLTMAYGGLFLLAGAILLSLNYALVRRSVGSTGPSASATFFAQKDPGRPGSQPPTKVIISANGVPAGVSGVAPAAGGVPVGVTGSAAVAGPGTVVVPEPTTPDGRKVSDVLADLANAYRHKTLHELVVKSLQALALMALASIGLGWVLAGRVLDPLHRMTATARKLSEENLHERIALDGPPDELKELADTFDDLLGRLESAFESQKRFVANASHELRTPLAIMRTEVDVALADPDTPSEELRRMGEVVRRATERSEHLIDGLLVLARSDRGPAGRAPVDLAGLAEEALALSAAEAGAAGVTTTVRFDPAPTSGDAALLGRLAGNLIENAIRHNDPAGGWLEVTTGPVPGSAGEVRLVVANTGPEIDAADVDGLFEPFRRLSGERVAPGRGAGLGLSIVRSVAGAHGGRVTARPRPGGGLVMEVVLPRTEFP
ncbi:MAG TPA: HAMP domain-containing sensor histidine kinase [Acidimicrobiia bacterium]|nr:HAMP domain-containing sensor histidine kinase [Acidimicrobiia bacterium]